VLGRIDEALETSINSRTETVVAISPDLLGGVRDGGLAVEGIAGCGKYYRL
jgi:hypothetical protein